MPLRPALALLLAIPAAAAPAATCTRAHDREIEIVLPAAIHARLAALKGPHARRAASFLVGHPAHTLTIGVRAPRANGYPTLPLMADNTLMQFMTGKGYMVEHSILHDIRSGERGIARRPADMAALADLLLPIWVHEISHGRVHERAVPWPISATMEDELIACYTQAAFTAELLAVEPGYADLRAVYRAQRAARRGDEDAVRAYRALSATKRAILQTLEVGAASTDEFERMYRRAYSMKSSLADPLTAGLRITEIRADLSRILGELKRLPPQQKTSADELLAYGREDDRFWLDPTAPSAASKDAARELQSLRAELDAARPELRAWFAAAAGEPIDWAKLAPPRDVPVGVAPADEGL
jgi:hypothetical protein